MPSNTICTETIPQRPQMKRHRISVQFRRIGLSAKSRHKRNKRKLSEFRKITMESTLQNQEINEDDEFI